MRKEPWRIRDSTVETMMKGKPPSRKGKERVRGRLKQSALRQQVLRVEYNMKHRHTWKLYAQIQNVPQIGNRVTIL